MKKIISFVTCLAMLITLVGCASGSSSSGSSSSGSSSAAASASSNSAPEAETQKITVAYQYGLYYAPLQVVKEQKLIEKHYPNVEIEWVVLNSGSAINEGVVSGQIDVAAMGIGPFIIGATKGVPYKMYSAISSFPHGLLTSNPELKSIADFTEQNKISLVNIGSFQHILLCMKADKVFGDPHALDNCVASMSNPDGMTALISGNVDAHLTTGSFVFKESALEGVELIEDFTDVWPHGNTHIVGLASTKLHDENPELYQAVVSATNDAIDFLNNNKEEAAKMLCENEGVDDQTLLSWLEDPSCIYSAKGEGIMEMAKFMEKAGFLDKAPEKIEEIVFE